MKVVDLNVLLYAVNREGAKHGVARAWLDDTLSGAEPIGLPWVVLMGFLRLSTSRVVFPKPLTAEQALSIVDSWLAQPSVVALVPGDDHWRVLRGLLEESGTAGNLTTDAHLAAMAIENGAELCSSDSDFARFRHLRWVNPLD